MGIQRFLTVPSTARVYTTTGDLTVLDCPQIPDEKPLPKVKAGGDAMRAILASVYNTILKTEKCPTEWTISKSMVITLTKKGSLQLCQDYKNISLISHPSKVKLKVIKSTPESKVKKIYHRIASWFQSRKEYDKHKILMKKLKKAEVQNAVISPPTPPPPPKKNKTKKKTDFLCIKYYHVNVQCISIVNTTYHTITEIDMEGVEFLLLSISNI